MTKNWRNIFIGACILGAFFIASASVSAQVSDAKIVLVKEFISASGYAKIAARCPSGYVAVSGGADFGGAMVTTLAPAFGNLALFELADGTQSLAPDGWYASSDSIEGGSIIALTVMCARLTSAAVTVVTSAQADYHTDTVATAQCPVGYRALGGGIDVERANTLTSEQYRISGSYPQPDGSDQGYSPVIGWKGSVFGAPLVFIVPNSTPGPVFKVGAICAQGVASTISSGFGVTPSAGIAVWVEARCPAGTYALAGGAYVPGQWLNSLEPLLGDDGVGIYQRNPGTYPIGNYWSVKAVKATNNYGFNAYAVCAPVRPSSAKNIAPILMLLLD